MNELESLIEEVRKRKIGAQAFGSIIGKINKNEILLEQIKEITKFLDVEYKNVSISQRFYHVWFDIGIELCKCGNPKKFTFNNKFSINQYEKRDANYCGSCGSEVCNKNYNTERGLKKVEQKYGTKNIWEIPGYRENLENSNLRKYGVKYYTESKEFKKKSKEKIDKRTPNDKIKINEKREKTNFKKYGKKCLLEDKEWKENKMMEKYGVRHNMQLEDIHEKTMNSMGRYYNYTLPSGKIIKLQGYENFGISYLLNYFDEDDIVTGSKEIKKYTKSIIYENNKRYYPDFYIKSINKIFEIKSPYTYKLHREINEKKKERCIELNINFEFLIFDKNGNLINN